MICNLQVDRGGLHVKSIVFLHGIEKQIGAAFTPILEIFMFCIFDWIKELNILSSDSFIHEWRSTMRISARNILKGKVKKIMAGAVNSEIIIELPDGTEIVSIITKDSVKSLELKKGKDVYAVIKASNVMIGVDH